jgi:hypothetical protein
MKLREITVQYTPNPDFWVLHTLVGPGKSGEIMSKGGVDHVLHCLDSKIDQCPLNLILEKQC